MENIWQKNRLSSCLSAYNRFNAITISFNVTDENKIVSFFPRFHKLCNFSSIFHRITFFWQILKLYSFYLPNLNESINALHKCWDFSFIPITFLLQCNQSTQKNAINEISLPQNCVFLQFYSTHYYFD